MSMERVGRNGGDKAERGVMKGVLGTYWVVFPAPVSPTMTIIWLLLNFVQILVIEAMLM